MSNALRGMARESKQKGKPLAAWKDLVLGIYEKLQRLNSISSDAEVDAAILELENIQLMMLTLEDKYKLT